MPSDDSLIQIATQNVQTILSQVFEQKPGQDILIVYDERAPLTRILTRAYQNAAPHARNLSFDAHDNAGVLSAINALKPGDLVILIQSTSFRLDEFRIRLYLFTRQLKVIEHPHLERVLESERQTYIDSLEYDGGYYRRLGPELKSRIDRAHQISLHAGSRSLVYGGPLEEAKLNIGDYRAMKNSGGQFPIGEVFTELKDLTQLNGTAALFAFGGRDFGVYDCPDPIIIEIKAGRIVSATPKVEEFEAVLQEIRDHEGEVWVRELGFGLNRALTRERQIRHDVGMFERMCGIHMSLGAKHPTYPKEGFHRRQVKYHVDVFAVTDQVKIDDQVVYENGGYTV